MLRFNSPEVVHSVTGSALCSAFTCNMSEQNTDSHARGGVGRWLHHQNIVWRMLFIYMVYCKYCQLKIGYLNTWIIIRTFLLQCLAFKLFHAPPHITVFICSPPVPWTTVVLSALWCLHQWQQQLQSKLRPIIQERGKKGDPCFTGRLLSEVAKVTMTDKSKCNMMDDE